MACSLCVVFMSVEAVMHQSVQDWAASILCYCPREMLERGTFSLQDVCCVMHKNENEESVFLK